MLDGESPDTTVDTSGTESEPFDTAMDGAGLIGELARAANPEKSGPMAAYMRDQFPFLGVPASVRQPIQRPYFAVARKDPHADWGFVAQCWALPQREFQYLACDYLYAVRRRLGDEDLPRIKALASSKQWWDTIDSLTKTAGAIVAAQPRATNHSRGGAPVALASKKITGGSAETVRGGEYPTSRGENPALVHLLEWSRDGDFWIRRLAILHQLGRKAATDTASLEAILTANLGSGEFFINKAIGWALRDYSKTDPDWVSQFIARYRNQMNALSIREGSKYIPV